MVIAGIVALALWVCFQQYSESKLRKIHREFFTHGAAQKAKDIQSYRKHLLFVKLTRFAFEKLPYIAMAVIVIIVSGPFGVLVVLLALRFKRSLFDTNYKGYRTHKNAQKQHMKQLDEWLVIANQTILK
jgi:hypothetical protein